MVLQEVAWDKKETPDFSPNLFCLCLACLRKGLLHPASTGSGALHVSFLTYILLPAGCTWETHQEPHHCSPPPSPSPQATSPTALTRITATVFFYPTLGALVVKNPPANSRDKRDAGSIPGSGRSPGGGPGSPLQYSCLENPMDRGAWRAAVHGVTLSWT